MVVNSAGIMPLGRIADGDMEVFDKVIATNLRGAFLVLRQAAQHVVEGGRIIALSSSVLAKSFPTYGPYIASKAGVEGLVHVLNNELRGRNITVNAVAPGPVATELFLKGKTQAQIEQFIKLAPLERLGQPEDIANVVSFLAGPDGAGSTAKCCAPTAALPEQSRTTSAPLTILMQGEYPIMKNIIVITGASSGCRRDRQGGRCSFWQAAFPRTHRPDAGRRGSSQYGFGPCARRALRRIGLGDLLVPRDLSSSN